MASKTDSPASTSSLYTAEALSEKIAAAAKVLAPCMKAATPDKQESAAVVHITQSLAEMGIFADADSHKLMMEDCTTERILSALVCETVPQLRAQKAAVILRPAGIIETAQSALVAAIGKLTEKPVAQWSDRMLVESLRADHDQYDEIAETLDKRAQGRPFVVYADEAKGEIDTDTTLKMLGFAKKGRSPVNFRVGNCLKKLYRSVEPPNVMFVECPFHPGTLLVDGYCDECGQNWDGTAYEALQFARIVQEAGDAPEKAPDVKRFFKLAIEGGLDALRDEYEVAAMTYDELALGGNLPNLRRRQSSGRAVSDPMNPGRRF